MVSRSRTIRQRMTGRLYRWALRRVLRDHARRIAADADWQHRREAMTDAERDHAVAQSRALTGALAQAKTIDEIDASLEQWRSEWRSGGQP